MTRDTKLFLHITYTVCTLQLVSSSYYESNVYYQNPGQQEYYEYDEMDDYDTEHRHNRRRGEKAHHYDQDYPDDCSDTNQDCSCNKCNNPTPCCQSFCASCPYMSGQPPFFFVSYPYPLVPMVPGTVQNGTDLALRSKVTTVAPVTTSRTTTETVATTKVTSNSDTLRYVEDTEIAVLKAPVKRNSSNSKYMLTSLRRTKPTWVPKYGIVPIPNNLAEKLLSQMREVKEYNYKARETV